MHIYIERDSEKVTKYVGTGTKSVRESFSEEIKQNC